MPLLGLKPFPQGCAQVPILGCCNVRELLVLSSYQAQVALQGRNAHTLAYALVPLSVKPGRSPPMLAHQ